MSKTYMILLSLQPSPSSQTSTFNKILTFNNLFTYLFPLHINSYKYSHSPTLNHTTYFFT